MAFILARKVKMSQQYRGDEVVPVTILAVEPCVVTQVRTRARDGYTAVQLGTGKRRKVTKPIAGHLGDRGTLRTLHEFRVPESATFSIGDRFDISTFAIGDAVRVAAVTKGKGYQGVIRRHRFHGQDAGHGTKDQVRMPGSISGMGRGGGGPVNKGKRMAGRMGGERVTVRGLEIMAVDGDRGELMVRGAVPGARGALVEIRTDEGSWK